MTKGGSKRTRRPWALGPQGPFDVIQDRVAAALAAAPGSTEALACSQEALFTLMQLLGGALGTSVGGKPSQPCGRAEWLSVLRFLHGGLVFNPELHSLIVALAELDRGALHPDLAPKGNLQGGGADTRKLRWRAVAVEAFNLLVEAHGGAIGAAEEEAEDFAAIPRSTLRDWRRSVRRAPPEIAPGAHGLRWLVRSDGTRLDPLEALRFAYERAIDP
jgi:hypothetical protein